MRPIILAEDSDTENKPGYIFDISDAVGRQSDTFVKSILWSNMDVKQKVEKIIAAKRKGNTLIQNLDEMGEIKDSFMLDGGIRLTEKDIQDIVDKLYRIDESQNTSLDTTAENPYIYALYNDFCYFRGESLNFRNNKYYFLFDSVKIDPNTITTSINDFNIVDIDIEKFRQDIYRQYNRVNQHLRLFLEYFSGMTTVNLADNFDEFQKDFTKICFPEKIDSLEERMKSFKFSPNEVFNKKILAQNLNLISLMREFMEMIETLSRQKNSEDRVGFYRKVSHFIDFLNLQSIGFSQIKAMFNIDVGEVFRKYVYSWIFPAQKKVILWLLDAKINILAFMQNITQILWNKNFLDIHFSGDLVLRKDQLEYMAKIAPDVIESFRIQQSKVLTKNDDNRDLAMELDASIGYFMDILIWDKPEAYVYAGSLISSELKEIQEGYSEEPVECFEAAFELLQTVFDGLEVYSDRLDAPKHQKYKGEVERNRKKAEKGKPVTPPKEVIEGRNKNYLDAKATLFKKLFRLHREENHPLIMIKTAQNAYLHIANEGYDHAKSLHILSVNYGGSLVGYYAKHAFERLSRTGRVMINIGNIIYSIYDLKNANDFLGIIDYPFSEYMDEFQSEDMRQFFKERNHLLIFDDNTSSGRTLNNLKMLAQSAQAYGKVDIFACRANPNIDIYDPDIPEELKLHLIRNSALETRKTRIGTVKRGYKEIVGAWIGNSLYKSGYRWDK